MPSKAFIPAFYKDKIVCHRAIIASSFCRVRGPPGSFDQAEGESYTALRSFSMISCGRRVKSDGEQVHRQQPGVGGTNNYRYVSRVCDPPGLLLTGIAWNIATLADLNAWREFNVDTASAVL